MNYDRHVTMNSGSKVQSGYGHIPLPNREMNISPSKDCTSKLRIKHLSNTDKKPKNLKMVLSNEKENKFEAVPKIKNN